MSNAKYLMSIVASAALMAGCTTATPMYNPDGTQGFKVSCGGKLNSFGSCIEKAGQVCGPAGYKVLGSNGEESKFSQAGASWNQFGGDFNAQNTTFISRELFIKCNK